MTARCSTPSWTDRTVYLVLCQYRDCLAWAERDVMRSDKRETIEDIRSGQLSGVVQVIELNVAEFSSRDVTEDLLQEVKHEAAIRWCQEADVAAERQAARFDHIHDLRKHEVA